MYGHPFQRIIIAFTERKGYNYHGMRIFKEYCE